MLFRQILRLLDRTSTSQHWLEKLKHRERSSSKRSAGFVHIWQIIIVSHHQPAAQQRINQDTSAQHRPKIEMKN